MTGFQCVPSARLKALIDAMGGTYSASRAWGVEYRSLQRFIMDGGGLLGDTIATILERSSLEYSALFAHRAGTRAQTAKAREAREKASPRMIARGAD